jgi:non-specific serine/threonine protein kinase/serine/threonine-protein kinase
VQGQAAAGTVTPEASDRSSKPEKLRRQLAGDLDNIVLKALRKEPERRYASVEQFSEDIRRHIVGLPVTAGKKTWGYRAQKFVLRNKLAVAAFALLILSLSAGLITTLHEARIARAQRVKADRRFQDVRELANSLMFEVHDGIANLSGATPVRKLLVERALKYLDRLAKDANGDHSLEMELAAAYDKIGDVQGQPMEANLGDPAAAAASYEKALRLRELLAAEDPKDTGVARELVNSYIRLSDLLGHQGDFTQALRYARKEIPAAQALIQQDASSAQNKLLLASCYSHQGFKEAMAGERAAGLQMLNQGAIMFEQLLSENPLDSSLRRKLALTYGRIADIQRNAGSKGDDESLASFRKAMATLQPLIMQDPNNAEIRRILAYYERSIGELLDDMNQKPPALAEEREALASLQKLAGADPANIQLKQDIAIVQERIGVLLTELGNAQTGIAELEDSVAALEKGRDAKTPESYYGFRLLVAQLWLGNAHVALSSSANATAKQKNEHCREAKSWFQRCLPGFEALRDKGADYDAASALDEIHRQMSRCDAPDHH